MFIKNANLRHGRRHHELLLPRRPYRGEPPTVAGFLLYPDTPVKMETTSREAFCFRPAPRLDRGKGLRSYHNQEGGHISALQGGHRCPPTPRRQPGGGNGSGDGEPAEDEREGNHDQPTPTEMKSQYQKDFPPRSSCRGRRTPAPPQPDNIGINRAFRIDLSTIQRETFPGWPVPDPRGARSRPRAASLGQPNGTEPLADGLPRAREVS